MTHQLNFCRIVLAITLLLPTFAMAQDHLEAAPAHATLPYSFAEYAIESIRDSHTSNDPVIVEQSELNQLIHPDGGGACPISAALIAMQTMRSMASVPLEDHPHRFALRIFQESPELKEGRITNERFVSLLKMIAADLIGVSADIKVVSARNSSYTSSGPYWNGEAGPDLETSPGEMFHRQVRLFGSVTSGALGFGVG